ncbi:MAG TPA: hypothetical protein VE243_07715 [Candidatus Acidoferrum sp.]|nr:hypothetical protein [Candidatus Acidoferrum sp.]
MRSSLDAIKISDEHRIGKNMITVLEHRWVVAAFAIAMSLTCARPAFSSNALNFPKTSFTIVNPDTGAAIGTSKYRVETRDDIATLRGENGYFDGQTDVETAQLWLGSPGPMPKLVEFDHTFYNADGSILLRAHVDLKTGAATCTDNSGGKKSEQSEVLTIPDDTWAGASIVLPIQKFLRAGDKGLTRPLHAFNCAPGPKIFAISVNIDPGNAVWTSYGAEALRIEVKPDFGMFNILIGAFVPRLHAWFDPNNGWAFVGDEAGRYYKGPKMMLVKKNGETPDVARRAK